MGNIDQFLFFFKGRGKETGACGEFSRQRLMSVGQKNNKCIIG